MAKDGALHRVLEGLRTMLASYKDIDTPSERSDLQKAAPIPLGTSLVTEPAWAWLRKHGDLETALVEPLLRGERSLAVVGEHTLDVVKTATGRTVVLDCLVYKGHDIRREALTDRRWRAALVVKGCHEAGDTRWTLTPAFEVSTRVELAQAWSRASKMPDSAGMVLKRSGPYGAGVSKHWIAVRKDPTAADVHVDGTNWGGAVKVPPANYDEESALIVSNQQSAEARGIHAYKSGAYANADGSNRCLMCGGSEPMSKMCAGYGVQKGQWTAAEMDQLPDSSFAYIAPGGSKDSDGKTTPRSLRHLPYKGKDGAVDLPHLRNALARLDQTGIPAEAKAAARSKLEAAAKSHGVGKMLRVVKRDAAQRIMLGVVHQPDVEDLQGDIISAPEIEKAAYGFLAKLLQGEAALNLDHTQPLSSKDAQLVEHYIAPIDFQIPQPDGTAETVLKGSWLQAWRLSPALWSKVEKGEYTGFSMGGYGKQTPVTKDADDAVLDRPTIRVDLEQPAPPPPPPQPNIEVHIHQPSQAGKFRMQKNGQTVAELERIPDGEE